MSFTYETKYSQDEILAKAKTHLKAVGYHTKTKGYVIEARDGACFFGRCFLGRNRIAVDASSVGKFTVQYDGSKAIAEAERLCNMFKS